MYRLSIQQRAVLAGATFWLLALTSPKVLALDLQGNYSCQLKGTATYFTLDAPRQRAQVSAAGELELEVGGGRVEIFNLGFTTEAAPFIPPLTMALDPAVRSSGPVRPLISSFVVPVGLNITEDATREPVHVPAQLFATFVTEGLTGAIGGQLSAELAPPAGARFSLELACHQAPISVSIDKRRICPGEDFVVEVESAGADQTWIDGVTGTRRVFEFAGKPGPRRILVTTREAGGGYQHRVVTVELLDCGPNERFAVLLIAPSIFRPQEVELLVDNAEVLDLSGAEYRWSFGDGTTSTTKVPFVTHSYAEHMPVEQELVTFDVEVIIQTPSRPQQAARKTAILWNHYAFNRRRGTIQLPAEVARPRLVASEGNWTSELTLRNLESEPVDFERLELELQPCDGGVEPQSMEPLAIAVHLQARANATLPVSIPQSETPAGTCGLAVHLSGRGPEGLAAQTDAYFDVPRQDLGGAPVEPDVSAFLNELATAGLVSDPNFVSLEEVRRLSLQGRLPLLSQSSPTTPTATVAGIPGEDEEPVPGAECNPSAAGRPGLRCQATNEFAEDPTPPRVANALKGDLLLHAACEQVGLVLRQLVVPQQYTHEAIMTQNYFELRHHTVPFDWLADHRSSFPGLTFEGDALKYGWPGTLTMSTTDAFLGRAFADPEGKNHTLRAIDFRPTRCFEDPGDLVPPLVVKPHRDGYTPEVRERLRKAADKAKEIQGHYRFFGFTNGSIGLPENSSFNAPDRIDWAAGSPAAVSSTFIWTALHLAGVQLEGDLRDGPEDVEDIKNGARQDALTLDGQYFYDEDERRAGLEVLYNDVERLQQESAGAFLGFFGQTSDQLANCFAADRCSDDDTDKGWKNPGVGRTTSPNNFLFWDKPKYGGSYGFSEPLVFRDGGYRRIHRWAPSEGTGRVEVTVVLDADGSPVQDARVVLLGLDHPTDNFGRTVFEAIPEGTYELQANKLTTGVPPQFFSADCRSGGCLVFVNRGTTSTITLRLRREPSRNRLVSFIGTIKATDGEFGPDEDGSWRVNESCAVRPEQREDRFEFRRCLGDEVVVKLKVTCRLLADNVTVNVAGTAELHESTGCGNELEDSKDFLHDLAPQASAKVDIHLNVDELGDDSTADFNLTIVNGEAI